MRTTFPPAYSDLPKNKRIDERFIDGSKRRDAKVAGGHRDHRRVIAEKHIGERIRRLRLKKSMGLVELGKHTGLSASFLSQLETAGWCHLRNLARIAMVFSKDLSYFFESEPQAVFRVHRRAERVRLPQTGVEFPTYSLRALATRCRTGTWTPTLPSFSR